MYCCVLLFLPFLSSHFSLRLSLSSFAFVSFAHLVDHYSSNHLYFTYHHHCFDKLRAILFFFGRSQFICRVWNHLIDGTHRTCMNNCQVLRLCAKERYECMLVKLFDHSKAPNKQRKSTNTRTNARLCECTDPKPIQSIT